METVVLQFLQKSTVDLNTILIAYLILKDYEKEKWLIELRKALVESSRDVTKKDLEFKTRLPSVKQIMRRKKI